MAITTLFDYSQIPIQLIPSISAHDTEAMAQPQVPSQRELCCHSPALRERLWPAPLVKTGKESAHSILLPVSLGP